VAGRTIFALTGVISISSSNTYFDTPERCHVNKNLNAKCLPTLAAVMCLMAMGARAEEELNPMGGIVRGNAEGTIPTWSGGLKRAASHKGRVVNPFADDKVLYTITGQNLDAYAHLLSAGQQAMLKQYPDSFVIPVYPSRRSASYPGFVYEALLKNRETATLITEGVKTGVRNATITSPFPEPENGLQAVWNHTMRWRGILLTRETSWVPVTAGGRYRPLLLREEIAFPYASPLYRGHQDPDSGHQDPAQTSAPGYSTATIAVKRKFISPGSVSGQGYLYYDTYDYTLRERMRWVHVPQLKRVLRLPRARLDQPLALAAGIVGLDDRDLYKGSPELFDWELLGRHEMLVPYNAYALDNYQLSFKDLIDKHHLNQQHTRYELHRVWKVVGTAKGPKSTYGKRIFYIDEDTWQIVLGEKYDRAGELVMHAEAHTQNFYDVPVVFTGVNVYYRLDDRRFLVTDINNMMQPYQWEDDINPRDFGPNSLKNYVR
jgi:hypothetical protein